MNNQRPEDLVQSSFTTEQCSIPTAVVAQRVTRDYRSKTSGSTRKRRLSGSEPQNGSPTQMPLTEQEQPSTSNQQGSEQRQNLLQQVDMPNGHYSQAPGSQPGHCLPTSNQQAKGHYWMMMPQQPMMSQHHWGHCAHCNSQAVYYEDDWHYPCGRVKELTSHHVISEDMLRAYGVENGEVLLEVIPPPPIPLFTSAPRPNTNYATDSTSRQVPKVPCCTHCGGQAVYHESDWHYPCGRVKELTCHHLISEDMLRPCGIENGEIIYDVVPPPPRPITDAMDVNEQVPKASQSPRKPKRIINPDTVEIPTGFTRFRDQNWFKFRKELGTKDPKVIAEALQEHWWSMSGADRYKYEKQARTARSVARQINPELCPSSPTMSQETYLLSLSKRKRRKMEKELGIEKKKTRQKKTQEKKNEKMQKK